VAIRFPNPPPLPRPLYRRRADHPADWTPLLSVLVKTQAFTQFIDERLPSAFPISTNTRSHGACPDPPLLVQPLGRRCSTQSHTHLWFPSPTLSRTDITFFDESIRAKMNRYTFRRRSQGTPFLSDNSNRHSKTYVPPSPDTTELPERDEPYVYTFFPKLQ